MNIRLQKNRLKIRNINIFDSITDILSLNDLLKEVAVYENGILKNTYLIGPPLEINIKD